MKVLFVVTSLSRGGAERQVLDLADTLSERGHAVTVAYLTTPSVLQPERPKVKMFFLDVRKSPFSVLRGLLRLVALIHQFKPDVVHSHMVHANLFARLTRLFSKMPRLVCTAHNTNEGGRLRMLAYRLTDFLADISTNVSEEAVRAFEQKGAVAPGRMIPVLNGIDLRKFCPDEKRRAEMRARLGLESERLVLAVGRLVDAKDYPNLIKAFEAVCRQGEHIRLWIVGDGPLRHALGELVEKSSLGVRVQFLGNRDDVPDLMRAADVFVLSSAWEGFGLVVAEAMASEKVVVATDSGGVKEVLGDCGFLVPARDSGALCSALATALALPPDAAAELGRRARCRVVSRFGLDTAVDRWMEIYSTKPLLS